MIFLETKVCEISAILKIIRFISELINIIFFIVPMILIVLLMIDIGKAVISMNEDGFKKNRALFFRRLIMSLALFLIPRIVIATLLLLEGAASNTLNNYNTCIENMNNIKYYENIEKIEKKKNDEAEQRKQEEIKAQMLGKITTSTRVLYNNKSSAPLNSNDGDTSGTFQGKTYNLSETEIKKLAAVCTREQGNSKKGIRAEAEIMANLFELKGKKYKNPYEYVARSGWFGNGVSSINTSNVSNQAIAIVKNVLVQGNRTMLPLYVDEHDCIYCGSAGWDIVKIKVDGKTITNGSGRLNHDNYIKDKTIIYNTYGSTWKFYIFPTKSSDPFGYTESSYKKITGKGW